MGYPTSTELKAKKTRLARALFKAADEARMTDAVLADTIGAGYSTMGKWRRGGVPQPTVDWLKNAVAKIRGQHPHPLPPVRSVKLNRSVETAASGNGDMEAFTALLLETVPTAALVAEVSRRMDRR